VAHSVTTSRSMRPRKAASQSAAWRRDSGLRWALDALQVVIDLLGEPLPESMWRRDLRRTPLPIGSTRADRLRRCLPHDLPGIRVRHRPVGLLAYSCHAGRAVRVAGIGLGGAYVLFVHPPPSSSSTSQTAIAVRSHGNVAPTCPSAAESDPREIFRLSRARMPFASFRPVGPAVSFAHLGDRGPPWPYSGIRGRSPCKSYASSR